MCNAIIGKVYSLVRVFPVPVESAVAIPYRSGGTKRFRHFYYGITGFQFLAQRFKFTMEHFVHTYRNKAFLIISYRPVPCAFVLLLACINFMNLSTARSEKRAREVGVRKAIVSLRQQLVLQFFSESFLVVFIAFLLSLGLVLLALLTVHE